MNKVTRRRWLSRLGKLLLLVVVAVGVMMALRPRPVPVDLARVVRGPLEVTLDHEGKTRVRDRFVVSTPLAGRISRVDLEPGDRVSKDRTLVATVESQGPEFLDPRLKAEAEARVLAARSSLERANAERSRLEVDHRQAETDLERSRQLLEKGVLSQADFDAADSRAAALQQALESAEAAIRVARFELQATEARLLDPLPTGELQPGVFDRRLVRIFAPVDGIVLKRFRESAAVVPEAEPLLEIADLQALEVVADFLSTDAVMIRPDMPVIIDRWGGQVPLRGRVRRVEPGGFMKISALGVEEQRVNVVVDFEDPTEAWQRLGDEYRVEVRVVTWKADDVLLVPIGALFRRGDDWAVFVVDGNLARLRTVELGRRDSLQAEVIEGLEVDEPVILYPPDRVIEGVEVVPRTG
jgi:HlyD family secretion protein